MVDFKKLIKESPQSNNLDPLEIFQRLDRESSKEHLWPPQQTILSLWHENRRNDRDVIVKLHTGQGKTLIGLLMLQSCLNAELGPAIYLCPNSYLVKQTVKEAGKFGIKTIEFSEENRLPSPFLNSRAILVTNYNKLFNGWSKFGVKGVSDITQIGSIVMDDAHSGIDKIRNAFSINIKRDITDNASNSIYKKLWNLFEETLSNQAPGTCSDIKYGRDSILAVPFWAWEEKQSQVLEILQQHKEETEIRLVWDLIKDNLSNSICIFSGTKLQIAPRVTPIEMIPSFANSKKRIFLSATLAEDAFLVRDLNIDPDSVEKPLTITDMKYSGERMVVMPTLVDSSVSRENLIEWLAKIADKRSEFGVIAITPSNKLSEYWKRFGSNVTDVTSLGNHIEELQNLLAKKESHKPIVLVNQYDGIDLPDNLCRILCLDSMPKYTSLLEGYLHKVRPNSTIIRKQIAQRIEQGMGRGIRGSSDWCIIIIAGNDLTDFLSEEVKRKFLSNEAQKQIEISETLGKNIRLDGAGLEGIEQLINQSIRREEDWKDYYRQEMEKITTKNIVTTYLTSAILERKAEMEFQEKNYLQAIKTVQELVNNSEDEKGWYLQLMSIYQYPSSKDISMNTQIKAHSENPNLFLPPEGIQYTKLQKGISERESLILDWIKTHQSKNSMILSLTNILENISFNQDSDTFEEGVKMLGKILGFPSHRPEKETRDGSDNLWHIIGDQFWIISCKNEILSGRETISERESGQFNSDIAWFKETYPNDEGIPVMIHPVSKLDDSAHLVEPSWCLTEQNLKKLKENIHNFYNSISGTNFDETTPTQIKTKLQENNLETSELQNNYLERITKS